MLARAAAPLTLTETLWLVVVGTEITNKYSIDLHCVWVCIVS